MRFGQFYKKSSGKKSLLKFGIFFSFIFWLDLQSFKNPMNLFPTIVVQHNDARLHMPSTSVGLNCQGQLIAKLNLLKPTMSEGASMG
jgi:hypothetical protein